MNNEPTWKACYSIAIACIIAVSGVSCKKQEPKRGEAAPKAAAPKSQPSDGAQQQTKAAASGSQDTEPQPEHKATQEAKSKLTVGEQILVYLGYKSGSSTIVKLCGQDMKGRGGLPSGVFLDQGTGFAAGFGPNEEIRILGKAGEEATLMCKEGATVEYADGLVLIMKDAHWIDNASGKDHGFGEIEEIHLR